LEKRVPWTRAYMIKPRQIHCEHLNLFPLWVVLSCVIIHSAIVMYQTGYPEDRRLITWTWKLVAAVIAKII
jgi:hypothetical protein